jgi:hypothetical protein
MAVIDFPASPSIGMKWPQPAIAGTPVYTWDGEKWTTYGISIAGQYVAKAGDVMSGHLQLPIGPAAANAVRKDYVDNAIATNTPPATTAAEYIANSQPTKMLTSGTTWGAAAPVQVNPVGSVININMSLGIDFFTTLTGAGMSMALPTNMKPGQKGLIYIINTGTGNGTITSWDAAWRFSSGVKPIVTPTANALDILSYAVVLSATALCCTFSPDFK